MTPEFKEARRLVMKEYGWTVADLDRILQGVHIDDLLEYALRNPLRQKGSQPCG